MNVALIDKATLIMNNDERARRYTDVLSPILVRLTEHVVGSEVNPASIDAAFTLLVKAILDVSEGLPRSKYRAHLKPFWNAELSHLKKLKVDAYRYWVTGGRPRDNSSNLYTCYKRTTKAFMSRLRALSVTYENDEIIRAVKLAEVDRNAFWRLVKKARGSRSVESISIRGDSGKVVYEVDDVLSVWREHFRKLGTPKVDTHYDEAHHEMVSRQVQLYNCGNEDDDFLMDPFTEGEIERAV